MAESRQRMRDEGPGRARWLALGGVVLVTLVFTFAVGVLVGRQSGRHEPPQAVEAGKKAGPLARRSGLSEPPPERPALQEKLTFYQTLTAPLGTVPASTKAEPAKKPQPPAPRPSPERPTPPADRLAPPTDRSTAPAATAVPARQDQPAVAAGPPPARAAEARPGDWSVQVGAFRDRDQAETVRKPLAAAGLDTYVTAVPADGGQMRYKVRVGSFKTREDATRMADRLRQERSLSAFVTGR